MDLPRLLSNSDRSDNLLKSKLKILERTLKVRGMEVTIIKSTNDMYAKVHGYNNIDLDGDYSYDTMTTTERLVINLNYLERVGEKSGTTQLVYHTKDIANEGDLIKYRSRIYEYSFKVTKKSTYGELNLLYEYELEHLQTIKIKK